MFADPPYNVPIAGHVGGLGGVQHREFAMASGEMSQGEFIQFLSQIFQAVVDVSADGAIHFVCMDWRHMGEVLSASKPAYSELKNLRVEQGQWGHGLVLQVEARARFCVQGRYRATP